MVPETNQNKGIMLTSFERTIKRFRRPDQAIIESVLLSWSVTSVGVTVAPNLRDREHFLPSRFMEQILRTIKSCSGLPVTRLEVKYQESCYRIQCRGGIAKIPTKNPILLGCAIDRELFLDHVIVSSAGYIATPGLADRLVKKLLMSGSRNLLPRERAIFLKAYTTWVTWDESDPVRDPFGFAIYGLGDEIRATLGLDERLRGGPLLLFRYEKPLSLEVHRPTVADAGLFKYFSPPILSNRHHGYSRPWERLSLRIGGIPMEVEATPRPEAVHVPIELGAITMRVSELP